MEERTGRESSRFSKRLPSSALRWRALDGARIPWYAFPMSPTAQKILEEAQQLSDKERFELMERLALMDDDSHTAERLADHEELMETLRDRAEGPFIPMDTPEQRKALWARVREKAKDA